MKKHTDTMIEKLRRTFYRRNLLLLVCAMICLVCYDIWGGLWLKGVTSAWFVVLGGLNVLYGRKKLRRLPHFLILIELGLVFGMCADVLLGIHFIAGILFFALGHIFYLVAFCTLEKFRRKDLYIILPLAVISLLILTATPYIRVDDPLLEKLLMAYAVIIAGMLGKAFSNYHGSRSVSRVLLLLGSAMFWFSDVMLAVDMFGTPSRLTWILCSYMYWPAQNILAFSLFHYVNEQEARNV